MDSDMPVLADHKLTFINFEDLPRVMANGEWESKDFILLAHLDDHDDNDNYTTKMRELLQRVDY